MAILNLDLSLIIFYLAMHFAFIPLLILKVIKVIQGLSELFFI